MVQLVLCCFYVSLFVFIIYKSAFFRLPGISSNVTVLFFILKVISATLLWKLFITYYPVSDSSVFFEDGNLLYEFFWKHPSQFIRLFFGIDETATEGLREQLKIWNNNDGFLFFNDSRTLIRLHTFIRFFSGGHFYVHALVLSFLSFTGFVYLYKLFFPYLRNAYFILIIACFLCPGVVFWSSTILKEGILFLGLGLTLYHSQCGLRRKYSVKNGLGLLLGTVILMLVKWYLVAALMPALVANGWITYTNHKRIILKYSLTYFFFLLLISIGPYLNPSFHIAKILKRKQTNFINMAKGGTVVYHDSRYVYLDFSNHAQKLEPAGESFYKLKKGIQYRVFKPNTTDTVWIDGSADTNRFKVLYSFSPAGSAFQMNRLQPSVVEILKRVPGSFFNTLVIPSIYSYHKPFSGCIAVENTFILLSLLLIVLFFLRKNVSLALVLFCFSFVLMLFSLIGLTTPILGALVRYRVPGIPLLIIGMALITDVKKISDFWKDLRNFFNASAGSKKY